MATPSRTVTRQHDSIASMASAAKKNAAAVSQGLNTRLSAQLEGVAPPGIDWEMILLKLGDYLLQNGNGLVERDEEVQLSLRVERQLRDRRNEVVKQIRNQLRGVRFLLDQAFGTERASAIFPARKTLSHLDPRNLLRVAKDTVALLEGSSLAWPPMDQVGHAPTPEQLLAALRQTVAVLETTLEELRPEKRGAQFALGSRQKDLQSSVDALQRGADCLFGLFRLGGFDFAAERLRPRRRRGKAAGEEEARAAALALPAAAAAAEPQLPAG